MSLETFYGVGIGYNFAIAIKKEQEMKQGKNDYQAALYQMIGFSSLTSLVGNILPLIPHPSFRLGATIGNSVLPFASMVLIPTSAAIKNGHYEQGVQGFDAICPRLKGILPEKIEESSVRLFSFLADNVNTMTCVGLTIGTVALPFFGFGSFAAGIGAPIVYHGLESANLIPSCINKFVEKYMPTVVNASMLLGGGPVSKMLALVTLSSGLPGASDFVQKKIERVFLNSTQGPSLKEIDEPWIENNDLSYDEILYILENNGDYFYEINPAHCSKNADLGANLPRDYEFKGFLTHFKKSNWKERYAVLKSSFKDDDRFIDLLEEKFGKQDFKNDFEIYIEKWALEIPLSKEEFLAKQLQDQMNDFVAILCKEKAVKGSACDLEDAIESCCLILAYLNSLPLSVEMEDILIKLAIEGGDYCARGIKRAAAEIASSLAYPIDDPHKKYELTIRQQLQHARRSIMENTYQIMIEKMIRLVKGECTYIPKTEQTTDALTVAIAQDVHTMDLYRQYLALGFYPLTDNERSQFGTTDLINWALYKSIRNDMYQIYHTKLDETIHDQGEIYFTEYIHHKIKELPLLPDEQEALLEKLIDYESGDKTIKSFHRLFLVMQGILRVKPVFMERFHRINQACMDWVETNPQPLISEELFEKELAEWETVSTG